MASPNLVPLLVVQFDMLSLEDGTTTKTVYCSNIALEDSPAILPIIDSIGALGTALDTYLPQASSSSITLKNSIGTYGFQRRFGDILERYSIIDQSVTAYLKFITPTTTSYTVSSSDQIWKAKAASYSMQFQGEPTISINLVADTIARDVLNNQITTELWSSAPTSALAKYLPFVIGVGVDVKPISVDVGHDTTSRYLYATIFQGAYPVQGVQSYYIRDFRNDYIEVISAASTSTSLLSSSPTSSSSLSLQYEKAGELPSTASANYLLQGGKITMYGNGSLSGTVDGDFVIRIYEQAPIDGPGDQIVGTAKVAKSTYSTQIQTTAEYTIDFCFDKVVPIESGRVYYVGIVDSNPDAVVSLGRIRTGSTGTQWGRSSDNGNWYERADGMKFEFRGVVFDDAPDSDPIYYDDFGLAPALVTMTQRSAPSGQVNPTIDGLDFVFGVNGFVDDGSGTLTGTPNLLLNAPKNIMRLLDREWNGSAWAAGKFDFTKFSASHTNTIDGGSAAYNRGVNGRIDGPATRDQIIAEVCKNSACRVTLHTGTTNQLGLYAWGNNVTSSRTITEEDCRIIRYEVRGSDSIVNYIPLRYSANLRYVKPLDFATAQQSVDLFGLSQLYDGSSALGTELLSKSVDLYGRRDLRESEFRLISDDASVLVMQKYIAARYGIADAYVTLELPDLNKYSGIEMLDVISVSSPVLPQYYGTAPDAYYPTYSATSVDLVAGEYWRRAPLVRMQVEAREVFFSENAPPSLRLLCRVLNNYPKDPT